MRCLVIGVSSASVTSIWNLKLTSACPAFGVIQQSLTEFLLEWLSFPKFIESLGRVRTLEKLSSPAGSSVMKQFVGNRVQILGGSGSSKSLEEWGKSPKIDKNSAG